MIPRRPGSILALVALPFAHIGSRFFLGHGDKYQDPIADMARNQKADLL